MKNSTIQWTHHTFNPWQGCTKTSEGCRNCYAEVSFGIAMKGIQWGPNAKRVRTTNSWKDPVRWNKRAARKGIRERVFCASLADVFENNVQVVAWRDQLHELIRATPHLDWLILTKRPDVAARYYQTRQVPDNVWLGVSVENQQRADERIPILQRIPARVRFLSCEPLLGELDISSYLATGEIHWVIVGGESTYRKHQILRPLNLDWARSVRRQCKASATQFFFKQVGGYLKRGRDAAGYTLDGRTYHNFPRAGAPVVRAA